MEPKEILKQEIITRVLSGSDLIKEAFKDNNDILISKKYSTGKYIINGDTFIRINIKDFNENFNDLFNLLLAVDTTKTDEDPEIVINNAIDKAIKDGLRFNNEPEELIERYKSLFVKEIEEYDIESKELDKSIYSIKESIKTIMDKIDNKDKLEPEKKNIEPSLDENYLEEQIEKNTFYSTLKDEGIEIDFKKLYNLKNKLLKSFKGYHGKIASYTPGKRFNLKKDIVDKDNIYYQYKHINGKKIKINFIVDMSGSMREDPVTNAISIIWLFNELAKEGYVEGNVIYTAGNSDDDTLHKTFPMRDEDVLGICDAYGGEEGIANTAKKYANILRNSHTICITDGNITDSPIKKSYWDKLRVHTTGVYVNPRVKNIDDLNYYKENLLKYFHNGVVRSSLEELIEWFMKFKIKG